MSDFNRIADEVLPLAFKLLPATMDSQPARAEMLSIGLQESRFEYRVQVGGPAHSYWQFERGGGVVGVLTHPATRALAKAVCDARNVQVSTLAVYEAMVNDDVLAACMARLLLYTLPDKLPLKGEHDKGWLQYISAWRPGMPHRGTWNAYYDQAWDKVSASSS